MRWLTVSWALAALVVLAFVDVPAARWMAVAPVILFGPGFVMARFVSPDDRRFRAPIALVSGLATLVVVSGAFTVAGRFSLASIAAVIAGVTVLGAVTAPTTTNVVTVLPPRPPIDPTSAAARRLRASSGAAGAVDISLTDREVDERSDRATGSTRDMVMAGAGVGFEAPPLVVSSPTLGVPPGGN